MDTSAPKMEARATTVHAPRVVRQRPASPGAEEPFRLGFRERTTTTPDGREVLEQAEAMRRYLEKRPGIVGRDARAEARREDVRARCGGDRGPLRHL
ncbi:MAG: hypothetical protein GY856_50815, partial [bacterium]|nr:hypothetical protein [bacterium]